MCTLCAESVHKCRGTFAVVAEPYWNMTTPSKNPTHLFIDIELLAEARVLKINLSRAAEAGLRMAVLEAKAEKWKVDNAGAMESSNAYVDKHGLPLDEYRQF